MPGYALRLAESAALGWRHSLTLTCYSNLTFMQAPPALLKFQNKHDKDDDVVFEESGHVYTFAPTQERIRTSVTGMLKPYFETFDGPAIAKSGIPRWSCDETSKYFQLIQYLRLVHGFDDERIAMEVVSLWAKNGAKAADAGTNMHRTLETHVQKEGLSVAADDAHGHEIQLFDNWFSNFFPEMQLKPWRCEFVCALVVDDVPVVAGSIDLILVDKHGRFWIVDYKRTNPSKCVLGKRKTHGFKNGPASGPFSKHESSDFVKYSAQLLSYQYILENGYGMAVAGCFMLQLHPSLSCANCVPAADLEDEVAEMFADEIAAAKAARQKTAEMSVAD